jgi:hypothetical protein
MFSTASMAGLAEPITARAARGNEAGEELRREVENELRDAVVELKRVTSDLRSSSKRWT